MNIISRVPGGTVKAHQIWCFNVFIFKSVSYLRNSKSNQQVHSSSVVFLWVLLKEIEKLAMSFYSAVHLAN